MVSPETWFNDLLRGSGDKNLAGAYSNMENAVNELSQAVGIATLKRVEILGDIVNSIDGKADLIIDYVKSMNENVTAIQQYNIAANAEQKIIGEGVQALQSVASRMLINEERIFGLLQLQKAKGGEGEESNNSQVCQTEAAKYDPKDKRRQAMNQITSILSIDDGLGWKESNDATKKLRQEMISRTAKGTGTWILEEDQYKAWIAGQTPIIWVRGTAGVGKSFLASTIATDLNSRLGDKGVSASFFFERVNNDLNFWYAAMASLAYQLADKNIKYCEVLASEMVKAAIQASWEKDFVGYFPKYQGQDVSRVFLVLDGIDELSPRERERLCNWIQDIATEKLDIRVLLTSRPDTPELLSMGVPTIDITSEKISGDMDKVINKSCASLSRLKKLRKPVINHIRHRVKQKADGRCTFENFSRINC